MMKTQFIRYRRYAGQLILSVLTFSYSKDNDGGAPLIEPVYDVYIAGYEYNNDSCFIDKYWKTELLCP